MRWLGVALLALLQSCTINPATGEQELNVPAVQRELALIGEDLDDLIAFAESGEEPDHDLAHDLRAAKSALELVVNGLTAYGAGGDGSRGALLVAIATADDLLEAALQEEDDRSAQVVYMGLRAVLRRVETYVDAPSNDEGGGATEGEESEG